MAVAEVRGLGLEDVEDDDAATLRPTRADRLERIWRMVEDIAAHPGQTRSDLALKYALSERQMQADLNLIKDTLKLPLERRQGYRFRTDTASSGMTLDDLQVLLLVLDRAALDPSIPTERLQSLVSALPGIVPVHLRPLLNVATRPSNGTAMRLPGMVRQLIEASVSRKYVELVYSSYAPVCLMARPSVRPETILCFDGHWYVLGHCAQKGRTMLFPLEPVLSIGTAVGARAA